MPSPLDFGGRVIACDSLAGPNQMRGAMDNIAGLLSLFLIGAAFLSSCNAPEAPKGSAPSPIIIMSE
jgi:predicted small secreted protein